MEEAGLYRYDIAHVSRPDKLDDPLNNTDLKVGIVIRYRQSLIGPWPSPQP